MTTAPANSVLPHDTTINVDVPCVRCGYNLRGLTPETRCPECGSPVAWSLHGNLLRFADAQWLATVKLGVALMLWSLLIGIVVGFVFGLLSAFVGVPPVAATIATIISGGMSLWAIVLITTPDPRITYTEKSVTIRKVIRLCAAINFAGRAIQQPLFGAGYPRVAAVLIGLTGLVGVVAFVGMFVYLRGLAERVPNEGLARSTRIVMWGYCGCMALGALTAVVVFVAVGASFAAWTPGAPPTGLGTAPGGGIRASLMIAAVPGCLAGLGSMVFGIWYVVLLFQYLSALRTALAEGEPMRTPSPA